MFLKLSLDLLSSNNIEMLQKITVKLLINQNFLGLRRLTQANMRLQGDISEDPVFPKVKIWNIKTNFKADACAVVILILIWIFLTDGFSPEGILQGMLWKLSRYVSFRSNLSWSCAPRLHPYIFLFLQTVVILVTFIKGLNLWDEFDRARVLDFLRQLYSQNRLLQQVS